MPRPFDPNLITGWKFITNYFLAGCNPGNLLVIDTNTEPEKDLALLFLTPDISDIVQEVFDPSRGRKRKPGRRGRKKPGGRGGLDISTIIARPIRAAANPFNALKMTPLRYVFPLWNIYEGLSFTAAVVDGLSDIGFDNLWGVLSVDPSQCSDIGRMERNSNFSQAIGGLNPPIAAGNAPNLIQQQQFTSIQSACSHNKDFHVAYECVAVNRFLGPVKGRLVLGTDPDTIVHWGDTVELNPGDAEPVGVSGTFDGGQTCYWGWQQMSPNFVALNEQQVIAFSEADWPWDWNH